MDEEFLKDLFASVGSISIKNMFGGQGIYVHGMIIAAVQSGNLMVKGDEECAAVYENAGMTRWAYENPKTGKATFMPYWKVNESALDDPDEMAALARHAFGAALRAKRKPA
ncbi:MAG: TfoX/Sxy family protein [Pseudomonadota bacterium]